MQMFMRRDIILALKGMSLVTWWGQGEHLKGSSGPHRLALTDWSKGFWNAESVVRKKEERGGGGTVSVTFIVKGCFYLMKEQIKSPKF